MADAARRRTVVRVAIVGVGLLVVANLFVFAGLANDESSEPTLPSAIERLYPNPQEVIRPQETVGADLRDDLQGELWVNGVVVPRDQLNGDPNLGMVTFRPGCAGRPVPEGSECAFREFDPGTYNLRVDYWPRTRTLEQATAAGEVGSFGWQVKVG
jgi:hypothetical protein